MTTPARSRSRSSAKAAGARFERQIADYLAATVDDRIDRKVRTGARDTGDIGGVRTPTGDRVTVEVKNVARVSLAAWVTEVEVERGNDDAQVGVVIHKRHGINDPAAQYVTMTLADFALLLGGEVDR